VIGGLRFCLEVLGNGLVGPHASCDHEVGNEDGTGGTLGVGAEANMDGDSQ